MDSLHRWIGRAGLVMVLGSLWLAAGCESQPHAQSASSSASTQAEEPPPPKFDSDLFSAAERGSQTGAAYCLNHGAAINAPNPRNGWTALHAAAFNGHKKLVAYLVAQGADPNAKSNDGNTPLHMAAANGHIKTTAELVSVTDLSIRNNNGKTPREVATAATLILFPTG